MAKQRVKHFDAGGGAYGDVTLDDGTTVNTDPTDTDTGTDLGPAPELTPAEEAARDAADQQALIDAGIPADTAAVLKSTPGLWDKIVAKFTDPKTGDLNWANIAKAVIPAAGGVAALVGNNSSSASGAQGYQGGIPSLTLSRTKNPIPTDRRPGAGGVSYFSPTTYLGNRNMTPGTAGGTAGSATTAPTGTAGGIAGAPATTGNYSGGYGSTPSSTGSSAVARGNTGAWANATVEQLDAASKQMSAQGIDFAEQARRAEAAGVNKDVLNAWSAQHQGAGRLAIDNAYSNYGLVQGKDPDGTYNSSTTYSRNGPNTAGQLSDTQQLQRAAGTGYGQQTPAMPTASAAPTTPSNADIMAWYKQHQSDANFQQEAQQAMQQYGITQGQLQSAGFSGTAGNYAPTATAYPKNAQPAAAAAPTDWNRYMQLNPDLGAAGINTAAAAQQHWQQFGQNENRQFAKGGGISGLPGAAPSQGRFLRGPGDGVSDSIPARIDGKKPAAIADGEFIIPARAVSEIGNGSSEAGSRKLYAMLDRIEKTRHRNKNTAKDTRADKHLPA